MKDNHNDAIRKIVNRLKKNPRLIDSVLDFLNKDPFVKGDWIFRVWKSNGDVDIALVSGKYTVSMFFRFDAKLEATHVELNCRTVFNDSDDGPWQVNDSRVSNFELLSYELMKEWAPHIMKAIAKNE